MNVQLLAEHHLEFLSLKGGCGGSSESTLVKMSKCWKSHAAAHLQYIIQTKIYLLHFLKKSQTNSKDISSIAEFILFQIQSFNVFLKQKIHFGL